MKIAHVNIRSLTSGFNDFKILVQQQDFDVIMVTETWLTDNILDNTVNIQGYRLIRKDRTSRGGGVAAYVKNYIKTFTLDFDFQFKSTLELLFLKIKLFNKTLIVGAFYKPPTANITSVVGDLDNVLSNTCYRCDLCVCVGDLNVNFLNLNNPVLKCFESYGFSQILNEPTRITSRSSTLIDPFFLNDVQKLKVCGTLHCDGTDHRLVFADLSLSFQKPRPKTVTTRCFRNFNYNDFYKDLIRVDFDKIFLEKNIDKKIQILNDLILDLFSIHAPLRECRVTKPFAPWLNDDIKNSQKMRNKALQKYKKSKLPADWGIYKSLRNQTVSIVRRAKKIYLNNICSENNSSKTWKALSKLNVKTHINNSISSYFTATDINNYFSNFFQNVSNKCDNRIDYYNKNLFNLNLNFTFSLASLEEVHDSLHRIKTDSYGTDNISAKMLKLCSPIIDIYILHIINSCTEKKYFPTAWKTSIGIPLPKNSNPENVSDLRVISLLPALSKIFERVLYNQISTYILSYNILPDTQCGFRQNFSTSTALLTVLDSIISAIDSGKVSVLVLLDFSKAFDTINHRLLCSKLRFYGFSHDAVSLIESYLSDRYQTIRFNNTSSANSAILSGVPQGSILGPLLFIIYTIDILQSVEKCSVAAYADDTQIYYHFQNAEFLLAEAIIDEELGKIKTIADEHNLTLNSSKSNVICFGSRKNRNLLKQNLNIKIDNVSLPIVTSAKNLGIVFDEDLRFCEHVKNVNKKAYCALKILFSNRHVLDFKLKRMLCDSLVLSHYNYADFVYSNCLYSSDRLRIQNMQNNCCRFIFGLRKFDRISQKIIECSWLNMEHRRQLHLASFVHTLLTTNNSSETLRLKFVPRYKSHSINIRHRGTFLIPRHHSALFQRSFLYNAIKIYNTIPDLFRQFNINKFKYKYRLMLFHKQGKTVNLNHH